MLDDFDTVEQLIEHTHLSAREVSVATAYRAAYPEEIQRAIDDNRRPLEDAAALFPFIET